MRVAVNIDCLGKPFSGIPRLVLGLLRELIPLRGDWEFLLYSNRACPPVVLSMLQFPNAHYRRVRIPVGVVWLNAYLPLLMRRDRIDVFLATEHTVPLVSSVPSVMMLYDFFTDVCPAVVPRKVRFARRISSYGLGIADRLICISAATYSDLQRVYPRVDITKAVVSYPGVDTGTFYPDPHRLGEIPGEYILTLGGTKKVKNVQSVLKAFAELAPSHAGLHLIIVGQGTLEDFALPCACREAIRERVVFMPSIDDRALRSLYSHALCTVVATLYEGFGFPLVEATACGCPVVAANHSSLAEIGPELGALLVCPTNVQEIARGITAAMQRPRPSCAAIIDGHYSGISHAADVARELETAAGV